MMRKITITIKKIDNGEKASIDVRHSNNGIQSEIESTVVSLLDSYLYEKVSEITESENDRRTIIADKMLLKN